MLRFSRPRLITFDDPAYRQHVEEMQLQRANQRALRPPSQRDLFGGEVEDLLRAALAHRFPLSQRRILDYNERIGQRWHRKFRELDAIIVEDQRVHIFEFKASRRAGAIHRAMRQLRDSRSILELLFRTVASTLIFVDTGVITAQERDALMANQDAPPQPPQTLSEAIADYPELCHVLVLDALSVFPTQAELLVLSVDDVVALAGDTPLSLAWDEEESGEVIDAPLPAPREPLYTSMEEQEEESPFAAAFRKAAQPKKR